MAAPLSQPVLILEPVAVQRGPAEDPVEGVGGFKRVLALLCHNYIINRDL